MKLCCDENIKRSVTELLVQEGYDVVRVQDVLELGFNDREILAFCRENGRVLVTNDDDFFEFDKHPGILFLDEQRTPPRDVVTALQRVERHVPEMADRVWHVPDGWV
jgi:predicted nuclease of predicted toxin-antitoxin system